MMMVLGNRSQRESDEEEDEEVGSGAYRGGEGEEEDEDGSDDDHDGRRTKDELSPLWKYVTRLGGGKGGETTKFTCPHCRKTYIDSCARVRKNLCGVMPCDEKKTI